MSNIETALRQTLEKILESVDAPALRTLDADSNLFDNLDSITIAEMLLEVEDRLEALTGNYVTLADEKVFDASKSPLRSWAGWVAYVEGRHAT